MAVDQNQVLVEGVQNLSPGAFAYGDASLQGATVTQDWLGRYSHLITKGYGYVALSGAAAAIPIQSSLSACPTLWNIGSSGKLVIPLRLAIGVAAVGTPVLQSFTISYVTATGDVAATNNPLATFTNVAPVNLLLGKGTAAKTRFANATVTFTTNPTMIMNLGIGHWIEGTAASGGSYSMVWDFDGLLQLPPGTAIAVGSTAATSTTYWTALYFAEIPQPLSY